MQAKEVLTALELSAVGVAVETDNVVEGNARVKEIQPNIQIYLKPQDIIKDSLKNEKGALINKDCNLQGRDEIKGVNYMKGR